MIIMRVLNVLFKLAKKGLIFAANILISILSLAIPKSKNIYVVGGWFGRRFADNSKYFFLYTNRDKEQLGIKKIIWITRSKSIKDEVRRMGYIAYTVWSPCSIWYHLRAKVHIVDQAHIDINSWFSVRSIRINMWHGFPLKKIGTFMDPIHRTGKLYRLFYYLTTPGFWKKLYILGTSEYAAEVMGVAFGTPEERRIVAGYPRNYEKVAEVPIKYVSESERPYLDRIRKAKACGKYVVACLPTFRDNASTLFFGTDDKEQILDLLGFLQEKNIILVGKFHYGGRNDKFDLLTGHEAFIDLPSDADLYNFISEMDMLVTDYSSICLDFMLWKKPVLFFPYDIGYYANSDRGLLFTYEELTPGPKVTSITAVKELLSGGVEGFAHIYFSEYGKAAERVVEKMFGDITSMTIDHFIKKIQQICKK